MQFSPIKLSAEQQRRIDELGQGFLQEFLEVEISRHPENVQALAELGQVYTNRGLCQQGLEVDLRLVSLIPEDPTVHYNLGCSYALLGQASSALDALELAVRLGFADFRLMSGDDDLASLREELRFRALLEHIRTKGSIHD